MKWLLIACCGLLAGGAAQAQTVRQLYQQRNYQALARHEAEAGSLTAEELYMVGFAFYQLSNDAKAISFYDRALAKGLDDGGIHFYKGLSLRYQGKLAEALPELELALLREPTNQEYLNEKGLVYYYQKQPAQALAVFEQAKKLPLTFPEPYYWAARLHHERDEFDQALAGYYETLRVLPLANSHYADALAAIGQLEYTHTHNFAKSAAAYAAALRLHPDNYPLYSKLAKAYNAGHAYARADSTFEVVRAAFAAGKLAANYPDMKSVALAEFTWNKQMAVVSRALAAPRDMLAVSYRITLLAPGGEQVDRRFVVERAQPIVKTDANFLLCELPGKGGHTTYPYGWVQETVPVNELQQAVERVLNKQLTPGASSNFGR